MVKTPRFELETRIDEAKELGQKARDVRSIEEISELLEYVKHQRHALNKLGRTDTPEIAKDKSDN